MKYFFMTAGSMPQRDYMWWKSKNIDNNLLLEKANDVDLPKIDISEASNFNNWIDNVCVTFSE